MNNYLQNEIDYASMEIEEARAIWEKNMTLAKIEKTYGNQIKQLPNNGRWWIRLNGNVIRKVTREAVIEEIWKKEQSPKSKKLKSVAQKWLEIRSNEVADGTWNKDYKFVQKYILDSPLQDRNVDTLKYSDAVRWAEYCLNQKPDMKEKYFKNIRCQMNKIFEFAQQEQLVKENPFKNLKMHRDKFQPATEHKDHDLIFSEDEKNKIKSLAWEDATKNRDTAALGLVFLFCTGIRDGELCELRWKDIENDKLHIQRELVICADKLSGKTAGYKTVFHTKSKAGNRYIPLNTEAKKILAQQREICISKGFSLNDEDCIFRRVKTGNTCQCTTRSFEPKLKRYCRMCGMTELKSQHDIRRTFCTNLFYAGMALKDIQKIMGHSSMQMTMEYIKYNEESDSLSYLEAI